MVSCFLCRLPASAHVIRSLHSESGPGGWARLCVPCAIKHDLDGVLLSPPSGRAHAEQWRAHRRERDSRA